MKSYEEYCKELEQKINSCRNGNTTYTEEDLKQMYENGLVLIKKVLDEPNIEFDSLFIGHNDFQIRFSKDDYLGEDYLDKKNISNLLKEWQSDKDENDNPKEKIISRFYSNGYGTAFCIPYN